MATKNDQYLYDKGYTQEQIDYMRNAIDSGGDVRTILTSVKPANAPVSSSNNTATPTPTPTPTPTETTRVEETIKETPVKQQETPISTVSEIKQEGALKPKTQEYYNQTSDEALNTIRDNLNRYKQTNPEYFTDYDSFKKNFSYNARTEEQKTVLDNWYKGYQNGLTLASTPVSDLYTQYQNGDLSSSQIENLRIANPTKYGELQTQINKGNIIAAYDDDKGEENSFDKLRNLWLENMITNLTTAGSESSKIFDVYEERMNSPEMLEISDKTTELQEQIENIQDDIASMTKAIETEYEGTGATKSKINAIVADRTYDLQLQLRTLNNEYSKYATQYNNRMQQYQQEFTMQLQEYQLGMQERNQKMNELGFAMDLMNYETPQQQEERQWNYWVKQQEYANGDINSKDETARYKAALKSVQNLLSQYEGIPMKRSAEQMAQDIITAINNGSNLGAELTKINKQIQEKPEYKKLYNQTFGGSQGFGQTISIGGTDYVEYNGKLYTADEFNKQFGNNTKAKEYTAISQTQLNNGKKSFFNNFDGKYSDGKGGWCGAFVNDYLQTLGIGRYYDNDLSTKLNSVNSQMPTIGSIAVFDYNHITDSTGQNHGHVAIVTDILPDGRIQVMDSNYDGDFKIKERLIDPNSTSLKGFFDPTIPYGGVSNNTATTTTITNNNKGTTTDTTTGVTYDDVGGINKAYEPTRVGLYNKYLNDGTAPTDAKLKALGGGDLDKGWQIFDAEVADYMEKTGVGSLDKQRNDEIKQLRKDLHQEQLYKDYRAMEGYYTKMDIAASKKTAQGDMALIFNYMKMLDPGSTVREGEYATAEKAGNIKTEIIQMYNKAVNGKKLTDEQRNNMVDVAKSLMDGATYNYNQLLDDYSGFIMYGGNAGGLGNKGTYYTDEYINRYGNNVENVDYWSEYRSSTPQGTDTINVGNGLSITRP